MNPAEASATIRTVSAMLQAAGRGDARALEALLPLLYDELRALARVKLARTPPGQTIQATALVHEAYLRLVDREAVAFHDRKHFFFVAARAMRDILVEQARRKAAAKHGGALRRVDAAALDDAIQAPAPDMLALHEALERLERDDPQKHRVVMLRFFAGLTAEQTAEAMDLSLRTVEREWRFARALLHRELSTAPGTRPEPAP